MAVSKDNVIPAIAEMRMYKGRLKKLSRVPMTEMQ